MQRRTAQRGFTFIEVLVVMGIIGVLAGLTVVAMQLVIQRGPAFETDTRVKKMAAVINQWHGRFERYPPTNPAQMRKVAGGSEAFPTMPNSTNVGIETLYQALYWPTFPADPKLGDEEVSNTDEDEFDKPTSQGNVVYEIRDAWGNPLVYFVHTDYAKADESPPAYLQGLDSGGMEVSPKPWKYGDEARGFAEPRGFQIYSMGEDGLPNTEDDIKSWE